MPEMQGAGRGDFKMAHDKDRDANLVAWMTKRPKARATLDILHQVIRFTGSFLDQVDILRGFHS